MRFNCSLNDEWISMNSNRLRRLESKPKPDENTFKIGDSVRARWSDSRKFAGTILDVLENSRHSVFITLIKHKFNTSLSYRYVPC